MVYGYLVKNVEKTAQNGKRYAARKLPNLPAHVMEKITQPLTSVNYLVFYDTFDKLHSMWKARCLRCVGRK